MESNSQKKLCKSTKIAFQGDCGAFSEMAAKNVFKGTQYKNIETIGKSTFHAVFLAVENEQVDYGIIPAENSISGTLHVVYDHLIRSNLKIVAECTNIEEHCLCVSPGTKLNQIERILSHPVIMEQCEAFILALEVKLKKKIERVSSWDSSGACVSIKEESQQISAAIASRQAAKHHNLEILQSGIGNELNNETRYLIVSQSSKPPLHLNTPQKSSIVVATPNEPGSLFKIVAAFSLRNLNILKIESRPASTATSFYSHQAYHWDYVFYIDYQPSTDVKTNQRLLENLEEHAMWIRELGKYSQNLSTTRVEQPRWHQVCDLTSF